MRTSIPINLAGHDIWAFVIEIGLGLRVRFSIDDWDRANIRCGQQVRVRVARRLPVWLIPLELVEVPPLLWVTLVSQWRPETLDPAAGQIHERFMVSSLFSHRGRIRKKSRGLHPTMRSRLDRPGG